MLHCLVLHSLRITILGASFLVEARGDESSASNGGPAAPAMVPPGMSSLIPPPNLHFNVQSLYHNPDRVMNARKAALQAKPDLTAELKATSAEAKAWQEKLEQAALKEDPDVEPFIPKMRLGREVAEANANGTPMLVKDLSRLQMGPQDWDKFNNAAEAARQHNPELEVEHKQWMQKESVFQKKLEAAMVEVDPNISPMLGSTQEANQKDKEAMANGPAPAVPDIDAMAARMKMHQDLYQKIRDQAFAAFAKESFMLPVGDQDLMKALIRIEAYLSVWGDFYGEGLERWATHVIEYENHQGVHSILLTTLYAERQLDKSYTLEENDAQTVRTLVEKFAASDYPAEWKLIAWQVAITNANNFRMLADMDSPTAKSLPDLFRKWGEIYQLMIKAAVPHDVLYHTGNGLLCIAQNESTLLDLAIGEIDRDFNEADGANPVRLAMDGQYFVDAAWNARGSGWASTVTDQGDKLFGERLAKADKILEAAYAKYPDESEMARTMIDVELGQGQGRDRMETWFQRAIKTNPDDYDAYKCKEWYLQPRWFGSPEDILNFGQECLKGENWSAKLPMILTTGVAEMAEQDPTLYTRPDVWPLIEKTYRAYLEHYPKSSFYRTSFAVHAFDGGHPDIAKEQLTILGNDWDRSTISPQKYFVMATKLGLQKSD